jgi:hypothetical protein
VPTANRNIWNEIERHAATVNQLIAEAKHRSFRPNPIAESDLYNSASCLLKSVHSLQPPSSTANHGVATATGLHANVLAVPTAPDDQQQQQSRRRKASALSSDGDERRRKPHAAEPGQACAQCHRTDSPEWRKGPNGQHSLCNACGLRYARQQAKLTRQ